MWYPLASQNPGRSCSISSAPATHFALFHAVKARHDQARRTAVLQRERFAIVKNRHQRILRQEILQRQIGGPAPVVPVNHHEVRLRARPAGQSHQLARGDTFPEIAQPRPARHAVKIAEHPAPRQLEKFLPAPLRRRCPRARRFGIASAPGRSPADRWHPAPATSWCATAPAESAARAAHRRSRSHPQAARWRRELHRPGSFVRSMPNMVIRSASHQNGICLR